MFMYLGAMFSALNLNVKLKWGQITLKRFSNTAAKTDLVLLESFTSSKRAKTAGRRYSMGLLSVYFQGKTSVKKGTKIQYLSQIPMGRREERLYVSTMEHMQAVFLFVFFITVTSGQDNGICYYYLLFYGIRWFELYKCLLLSYCCGFSIRQLSSFS